MARNALNGQPSRYAAEKLPTMRARWSGDAGASLRAMGPSVWPSTPLPALLGVTANAVGPAERYCAGFCAIGLYQIPEATWDGLRANAVVRRLLGRDAVPSSRFADAIPDQTATGLVSLRRDLDALVARLPAAVRPTEGSQWQLALAVMAYVVGVGGTVGALAPVADRLAVPEPERFGALARLAAASGERTLVYPATRAWQRLACGRALAATLGADATWYDVAAPPETEVALAQALYPPGPPPGSGGGRALLLAAVAGALAWYVWRR